MIFKNNFTTNSQNRESPSLQINTVNQQKKIIEKLEKEKTGLQKMVNEWTITKLTIEE